MRVYGNLMNRIQEAAFPTPKVGDGATILMFSDRHAATVISVITPSIVVIQEDSVKRIDKNGMSESQTYEYSPNLNGIQHTVTKRKSGRWVFMGELDRNGTAVSFGKRDHYYDFGF
jgi:hypothetical protein